MKVLAVLGGVASVLGLALLRGVVLRDMWSWFVVPLGLPSIGVLWAIGLSAMLAMFAQTHRVKTDDADSSWEKLVENFITALFATLAAWGIGALIHWGM